MGDRDGKQNKYRQEIQQVSPRLFDRLHFLEIYEAYKDIFCERQDPGGRAGSSGLASRLLTQSIRANGAPRCGEPTSCQRGNLW